MYGIKRSIEAAKGINGIRLVFLAQDLFSNCEKACTAWRRALRWTWTLPPSASCSIVEGLHGRPLQLILLDRFKRFHDSCVNSSNLGVKFLALNSSSNRLSIFDRNYV